VIVCRVYLEDGVPSHDLWGWAEAEHIPELGRLVPIELETGERQDGIVEHVRPGDGLTL
jgi:hypothetical protein